MATFDRMSLTGRSGIAYAFTVFPLGSTWEAIGAVYAILREGDDHGLGRRRTLSGFIPRRRDELPQWSVLYIGQTEDLRERFANSLRDHDLARIRASHIAACPVYSAERRRAIEFDLVQQFAPLKQQITRPDRTSLVETIIIEQRSACPY